MMTDPFWRGMAPFVFNVFSLNRIFTLISIASGEFPQIFIGIGNGNARLCRHWAGTGMVWSGEGLKAGCLIRERLQ